MRVALRGPGPASIEESWYCPEFGVRARNRALALACGGTRVDTTIGIEAC
jgi:hypothetical protein